jgi:hypothetical protein
VVEIKRFIIRGRVCSKTRDRPQADWLTAVTALGDSTQRKAAAVRLGSNRGHSVFGPQAFAALFSVLLNSSASRHCPIAFLPPLHHREQDRYGCLDAPWLSSCLPPVFRSSSVPLSFFPPPPSRVRSGARGPLNTRRCSLHY